MYKYYKHNKSEKIVKVIQYDGTEVSLKEITKYFACNILFTTNDILLCGYSLQTNDYIIMDDDNLICKYPSDNFNEFFKLHIIDRQFKYNKTIVKMLWEEILDNLNKYSVEKTDNIIIITSYRTNVQIILSDIITIARNESIYGRINLELLIMNNCEEICIE